MTPPPGALDALVRGELRDPHSYLGVHPEPGGAVVVRGMWPEARWATLVLGPGVERPMRVVHDRGVVEARLPEVPPPGYRIRYGFADGNTHEVVEPWGLWPTLGDLDLHLAGEGRHERIWEVLGAHPRVHDGVAGTAFAVWAPAARAVRVVGDWNQWDGRIHPMRSLGTSGVWELFVPGVGPGARYKFEVLGADGRLRLKSDPVAFRSEAAPGTASVVFASSHRWDDAAWMARRARADVRRDRMAIYEVHLGSWRRVPEEGDRPLTYRELAPLLCEHVGSLGFTHVEVLPPAEHPYDPSWGYQVTGYFAPTARFGDPDDFRHLVEELHRHGIGVIVDWVPAHFPRDEHGLARFDGTALYEHADPRRGEHPDWGTYEFNHGRHEVRNFLLANALFWLEEMHVDGLRVDAVASMLYLDYSRGAGEWVPNVHGGREDLEAISFLQEVNTVVHRDHPGVLTVAEESTAWDGVTRPVDAGGLGFTHKWNMGWMHDTLAYWQEDPVHRRWHHDKLTFGLLYAWSEHYVLPLSHDEVVHLKGSLLAKMPGDPWQAFANLRALYAWMWSQPGKQLLFMGAELAQAAEWSHERSLDWHLLDDPAHRGVRDLVAELNRVEAATPALHVGDDEPAGFAWLDADDAEHSVYAFERRVPGGDPRDVVVAVANLTPVPRHGYRVGLPVPGDWIDLLNTDDARWGGSGVVQPEVAGEPVPWQGRAQSAVLTLPPLAVRWLAPR
ncbi:MAG: 1,4-alpha-glucan branching protein GlgB [Acidimicrobiia bacterium]